LGQFSKNYRSSKKYGVGIRNPGSGKNLFRIPDPSPGVKKASDPGSGSTTLLIIPKIYVALFLAIQITDMKSTGNIILK
jgi:hypothetical protein